MVMASREFMIGTLMMAGVAVDCSAEPIEMLSSIQIKSLFTSSTISGRFGAEEKRFAQRNHANGIAVVHAEGSEVRHIPWLTQEPNFYCEDWAKSGVLCFQIGHDTASGKYYLFYEDGSSIGIEVQDGFHSIIFK